MEAFGVSYDYLKPREFTRITKSGEIQDPKFLFCNRLLTHCDITATQLGKTISEVAFSFSVPTFYVIVLKFTFGWAPRVEIQAESGCVGWVHLAFEPKYLNYIKLEIISKQS